MKYAVQQTTENPTQYGICTATGIIMSLCWAHAPHMPLTLETKAQAQYVLSMITEQQFLVKEMRLVTVSLDWLAKQSHRPVEYIGKLSKESQHELLLGIIKEQSVPPTPEQVYNRTMLDNYARLVSPCHNCAGVHPGDSEMNYCPHCGRKLN